MNTALVMPQRIGPYEVQRELGRGGMGVVYLAWDPRLERDVAIKTLTPAIAGDPDRLARFKHEARLVAQLNHPCICQIYHLLEHDGTTFLVLEYVPGRALNEMILREGPIAPATAMDLCAQVALAIEAAHGRGIVHRDLKPANIRVTADGAAKVLDFGVARVVGDADAAPGEGPLVGTPGYMAPEQVRREPGDARADIFAFGCVLYECLTGARALPGETFGQVRAATLERDPDWTKLPAALPAPVVALLRACLARPVAERLATISDARAVLDEHIGRRTPIAVHTVPAADGPGNLPRPTTSFVGRGPELGQLREQLPGVRLLSLVGAGGSGKTRLAIELARRARNEHPDGIYFAELAPTTDPETVASIIATAVDARERPGRTTLEALAAALAGRRVLLVLDNCEHVRASVATIVTALLESAPTLRMIATSREALHVAGEHLWQVTGLTLPVDDEPDAIDASEAVHLFVDRARALRRGFRLDEGNAPTIARICRRLDGIPLAIELAAGRTRVLTPEQIDAHLDDRFRLLRADETNVSERHRTLRAAIDWSYTQLGSGEQAMLRRLSVFAGSWTLEAAVAVCGPGGDVELDRDLDEFGVLDLLTHLVDKSLVVAEVTEDESRYSLLESVRQFAAERLAESGEAAATYGRLLDFILALAEAAEPELSGADQAVWLERLEPQHDTMHAALDHLDIIEDGTVKAQRLCRALMRFWLVRGHYRRGRKACIAALSPPDGQEHTVERARALHVAGVMAQALGDYGEATARSAAALEIHRELGDREGMATSLNSLGNSAYYRGDVVAAQRLHEESLALRRELGDDRGAATSLNNLGNVANDLGRLPVAKRLYEEALEINRRIGHRASEGINLNNLALVAYWQGELDEAKRLHTQSLDVRRAIGDQHGIAESMNQLSKVARLEGEHELARRLCFRGLRLRRKLGDKLGLTDSLDECVLLAAGLGESELAARLFGGVESLRAEIGAPRPAPEQAEIDDALAASRATLDAAFDEAAGTGAGQSLGVTIADASTWLDVDDDVTRRTVIATEHDAGPADTTWP